MKILVTRTEHEVTLGNNSRAATYLGKFVCYEARNVEKSRNTSVFKDCISFVWKKGKQDVA